MAPATSTRADRPGPVQDDLRIALPPADLSLSQDEEWCVVGVDGEWREIRLHDYDGLFSIPGLYERVIYDILKCNSPAKVRKLFEAELTASGTQADSLRALDLGAGNGMVGQELADMGVEFIVGADITEAAARATERDRPGIYADYQVVDMARLDEDDRRQLRGYDFNCLTCVAALGFGDIPTRAFANAFNLIERGGWAAFNIKSSFLERDHRGGFGRLIQSMIADKTLEVRDAHRYQHRLGTNRRPVEYTAIVGRKRRHVRVESAP